MDKKNTTNKTELPQEIRGAFKNNTKNNAGGNHSASIMWWILGLLALLVIVFFIGLWTGRLGTNFIEDRDNNIEQQRRQEVVDQQQPYIINVTPEERSERLQGFFGE